MNSEFLGLYHDWTSSYIFSAHGPADPRAKESYERLKNWCLEHKDEVKHCATELLEEEPNDIVMLLNDLYDVKIEGFMPLDQVCNVWLNILKETTDQNIDYYKDWREFNEYMKDHYIPWNPVHENDPNITLEDFKQGKRNKKK